MRYLIFGLLLIPAAVRAGGYTIPNESAREIGLSQATVAAQNGPEAVFQNSAALAGPQGFAASFSLELLANTTKWSDPVLGSASTENPASFPPAIFVSYGGMLGDRTWGLGAGFFVVGGGSLIWPQNWVGATRIQTVEQTVYLGQAGGAIEVLKGLKIGGTLLYYRGTEKLVQQVNFISGAANASLGLAGGAFSFGASLQLEIPGSPLTFAIDYRHQGDLTLKGDAHFENVPPVYQTTLQDQGVTESLRVPNELFVGLSLRPPEVPGLTVMGSWSLERWSVYLTDFFQGDKGFSVNVPRNYRDASVMRLGVEYAAGFHPPLTLRFGLQRSISNQPTDTISPSLSDGNSWGISGGFGYQLDPLLAGLRVDFGYQYIWFDRVTATGTDAFPGSYDTTVHLASLGLVWRPK